MTGYLPFDSRTYACGVTSDGLVMIYSEWAENNILKARVSRDDGITWDAPFVVDQLPADRAFSWMSFVQPATGYDDTARFFYGEYKVVDIFSLHNRRYKNRIHYAAIDLGNDCPADLSGSSDPNNPAFGVPDGILDASDFFYYIDQFAEGCP